MWQAARRLKRQLSAGRLSEHPQGKILLQTQLELAAALHNLGNKTNEAIQLLKEGMQLDASDAVVRVNKTKEAFSRPNPADPRYRDACFLHRA
jgi:hypothetical protein